MWRYLRNSHIDAMEWYNNTMAGHVAIEQYVLIGNLKRTDYRLYLEVGRWAISTNRMQWRVWENSPELASLWHSAYPEGIPGPHVRTQYELRLA